MAEYKIRGRQESTDSLNSSVATDYSEDDKDEYDIDDFTIIKTIGNFFFFSIMMTPGKAFSP